MVVRFERRIVHGTFPTLTINGEFRVSLKYCPLMVISVPPSILPLFGDIPSTARIHQSFSENNPITIHASIGLKIISLTT